MYISAETWPWNQPGWKPTAPPVTGHFVRFSDMGLPPPWGKGIVSIESGQEGGGGGGRGAGGRVVHGYIHCMPNGYTLPSPTPRPLPSGMLPLLWRLSPRQPGYVTTVWAETREERREKYVVAAQRV